MNIIREKLVSQSNLTSSIHNNRNVFFHQLGESENDKINPSLSLNNLNDNDVRNPKYKRLIQSEGTKVGQIQMDNYNNTNNLIQTFGSPAISPKEIGLRNNLSNLSNAHQNILSTQSSDKFMDNLSILNKTKELVNPNASESIYTSPDQEKQMKYFKNLEDNLVSFSPMKLYSRQKQKKNLVSFEGPGFFGKNKFI